MSRTIYYCAASLDGYIADVDDGIGWLTGYEGSYEAEEAEPGPMGEGNAYESFYDGVGALVSGAITYEFLLDHLGAGGDWPYPEKPYWVLSSRQLPPPDDERADVRVVSTEAAALHEQMIAAAGERDLWIVGGGNVASQFADAGLLDELILTVVPVILGDGKPLFDRPLPGGAMRLVSTGAFASGMVELRYELSPVR